MENTKNQQRKEKKIINNAKPDSHDKYLSIKRCYSSIEALSNILLLFCMYFFLIFFLFIEGQVRPRLDIVKKKFT